MKSRVNTILSGQWLCSAVAVFLFFSFMQVPCEASSWKKKRKEAVSREPGEKVKWTKSKYGLKALIELSNDRGKMIRDYNEDTKTYEKVRKALDRDNIKVGDNGDDVEKKYGAPVIKIDNDAAYGMKWVYKPGSSSFFEKEKIYLVFNEKNELMGWEIPGIAEE